MRANEYNIGHVDSSADNNSIEASLESEFTLDFNLFSPNTNIVPTKRYSVLQRKAFGEWWKNNYSHEYSFLFAVTFTSITTVDLMWIETLYHDFLGITMTEFFAKSVSDYIKEPCTIKEAMTSKEVNK